MIRRRKRIENPLISIIDDDRSFRHSLRRLVQSFGFNARAFESARQFFSSKTARSSVCLIVDLHMPEIDGFELVERVFRGPKLPVVLLSGDATESDFHRAKALGAVLLQKPVDAGILQRWLKRLCASSSQP